MLLSQLDMASLGMLFLSILGAVFLLAATPSPVLPEKHRALVMSHILSWCSFPVTAIKKRIRAWMFLIRGPSIIQEEYDKVTIAIFAIWMTSYHPVNGY